MEAHRTVLIVEDNLINREILREILASEYQVLEAGDGQEALSILEKQSDKISLILLDIVMPVMDGFTFLSHVKKEPSFASIPVIVTTQSNSEKDEVTALSHGAADFVPKTLPAADYSAPRGKYYQPAGNCCHGESAAV